MIKIRWLPIYQQLAVSRVKGAFWYIKYNMSIAAKDGYDILQVDEGGKENRLERMQIERSK